MNLKKGDVVYIPQNTRIGITEKFPRKSFLPATTPEPLRGILVEMNEGLSTVYLAGELVTVKTVDVKKWRNNGQASSVEKEFHPGFFPKRDLG